MEPEFVLVKKGKNTLFLRKDLRLAICLCLSTPNSILVDLISTEVICENRTPICFNSKFNS